MKTVRQTLQMVNGDYRVVEIFDTDEDKPYWIVERDVIVAGETVTLWADHEGCQSCIQWAAPDTYAPNTRAPDTDKIGSCQILGVRTHRGERCKCYIEADGERQ